jgi:hypothetical protein
VKLLWIVTYHVTRYVRRDVYVYRSNVQMHKVMVKLRLVKNIDLGSIKQMSFTSKHGVRRSVTECTVGHVSEIRIGVYTTTLLWLPAAAGNHKRM